LAFKVNFRDEDSSGNPSGSFNPHTWINGNDLVKIVPGTLDLGVYATGGFDVSKIVGLFDNDNIEGMIVGCAGGYSFTFVKSTGKLKAYSAVGTEVANNTDLLAITGVPFWAWGR
jgi:hypothetical protein